MRLKIFFLIILSLVLLGYFVSCDSSGYEKEEFSAEEDTSNVAPPPEIKQEVEQPKPEIKEETTPVIKPPQESYVVQIGAFRLKSNADDFLSKVNVQFDYGLQLRLVGGIYKIQTRGFSTLEEARTVLAHFTNAGYSDAFIVKEGLK